MSVDLSGELDRVRRWKRDAKSEELQALNVCVEELLNLYSIPYHDYLLLYHLDVFEGENSIDIVLKAETLSCVMSIQYDGRRVVSVDDRSELSMKGYAPEHISLADLVRLFVN